MRKGLFWVLCLSFTICVGCGPQAKTETNPTDASPPPKAVEAQPAETVAPKPSRESVEVVPKTYKEVLDIVYGIASSTPTRDSIFYKYVGVKEIAGHAKTEGIGYCIKDISGDGIPELIIGKIDKEHPDRGSRILLLYTRVNGEAYHVLSGWARNRYYLLDDGLLYHEGSGGAQYSTRNISRLSENGTSLKKLEEYTTYIHEGKTTRFGSFHKTYDENGNFSLEGISKDSELAQRWKDYRDRIAKIDLIPMSEYKLFHEQLRANENYAVCLRREEMGWYIIKDSLETDYEDDMLAIYTDVLVYDGKNNCSQICSYKFVYDEENYQMYSCDNDGELRPLNGGSWNEKVRDYCIGDKAHHVVCGEKFTRRYSLAESDGYVQCTRHHELIWYIVEDSLKVDSEDDMLVIYADVVTLNENTGETSICTYKYLYDEENNRMYSRGDDGILRELIDRGCWAANGRGYAIGNVAYYAAYGEMFITGVYEETQRLRALGRGSSEVLQSDKWFYTGKDGANYYLRQFHKANDWISAQVVRKDAKGKTTDSFLYYVYTYQAQCPYTIYKGTFFASPGEAVERGELYVDSDGNLRDDANPSAVAFFEWFWTNKLGREARR